MNRKSLKALSKQFRDEQGNVGIIGLMSIPLFVNQGYSSRASTRIL